VELLLRLRLRRRSRFDEQIIHRYPTLRAQPGDDLDQLRHPPILGRPLGPLRS
jgi:hypothetical protein